MDKNNNSFNIFFIFEIYIHFNYINIFTKLWKSNNIIIFFRFSLKIFNDKRWIDHNTIFVLSFRSSERRMERASWRFLRWFPRIREIMWSKRSMNTEKRRLSLDWSSDRWVTLGGRKNLWRWRRNWLLLRSRRDSRTEEWRRVSPRNLSASWLENHLQK